MTKPKFAIDIDPGHGMVRITMTGMFLPADVRAFAEARREAHRALGLPKNAHLTLNDVRQMIIQPQETVGAFYEMLADPDYRSRRLAFVSAPTLVRGQLLRALNGRDDARCFSDMAEAEGWLLEADAGTAPLRRFG
jgi:hypothetical protein